MKKILVCILSLIILAACIVTVSENNFNNIVAVNGTAQNFTVILDAGHGGEDGGAVASDGTLEKDINLEITDKISFLFDLFGINYIPVRTEDISVCDDGLNSVRARKSSDIHNRFKLINDTENSILLSIHQNKFVSEKYSGTQVFYAENSDTSSVLAQCIQDSVTTALQPENKRQIKPSGKSIYLLYNAKRPSVLVECGFISNFEELSKLKDSNYQKQIAYFITTGLLNYFKTTKEI